MQKTIVKYTPLDYKGETRKKMIAAGLVRIENDFEHTEDFSKGSFTGSVRYFFNDGSVLTDVKKFRKKVYNYQ